MKYERGNLYVGASCKSSICYCGPSSWGPLTNLGGSSKIGTTCWFGAGRQERGSSSRSGSARARWGGSRGLLPVKVMRQQTFSRPSDLVNSYPQNRSRNRKDKRFGCPSCVERNRSDCCHCFICGEEGHWAVSCLKKSNTQGNVNRSLQRGSPWPSPEESPRVNA